MQTKHERNISMCKSILIDKRNFNEVATEFGLSRTRLGGIVNSYIAKVSDEYRFNFTGTVSQWLLIQSEEQLTALHEKIKAMPPCKRSEHFAPKPLRDIEICRMLLVEKKHPDKVALHFGIGSQRVRGIFAKKMRKVSMVHRVYRLDFTGGLSHLIAYKSSESLHTLFERIEHLINQEMKQEQQK